MYRFFKLFLKRCDNLAAVGIVAEFNPIHSGHIHLLNEAKKYGTVVCALSGNFVQRGDAAIAEKRIRAKAALMCGADLVLEIPVGWSMSTAQNFALGGVAALKSVGCGTLFFGAECGDTDALLKTSEIFSNSQYSEKLKAYLKSGITFASARQKAAEALGAEGELLSYPNNNLGIEYMLAAKRLDADFAFHAVRRVGAEHDSETVSGGYAGASLLREKLKAGDFDFCRKYIPPCAYSLLDENSISDIKRAERAILAVLRTKKAEELSLLPDISEGIENKLFSAIRVSGSLEDLYINVKVKRYTHARIRRLFLSAFIGIDNSFFLKPPPYIRVLGFNKAGEKLLKSNAEKSDIPVITRCNEIKNLGEAAERVFSAECTATDLYQLTLPQIGECGKEYTEKIIKITEEI